MPGTSTLSILQITTELLLFRYLHRAYVKSLSLYIDISVRDFIYITASIHQFVNNTCSACHGLTYFRYACIFIYLKQIYRADN